MVVIACGAPKAPAVPTATPAGKSKPARTVSPEAVCSQYLRLVPTCEPLGFMHFSPPHCVDEWREMLGTTDEDPKLIARVRGIATCLVEHDDCNETMQCITAGTVDPTKQLRACDDRSADAVEHAVGIPRAEWAHRNGAGATSFHDVRSSKERPVEMCGVGEANDWLISLQCNDHSRPLTTERDAERSRPGNVGSGGRCNSVIDRYVVACPEASYEIFIDAYVCPRTE